METCGCSLMRSAAEWMPTSSAMSGRNHCGASTTTGWTSGHGDSCLETFPTAQCTAVVYAYLGLSPGGRNLTSYKPDFDFGPGVL
ncbi:hypothetical protein MRX96_009603 [Rhipicephalus microplus]